MPPRRVGGQPLHPIYALLERKDLDRKVKAKILGQNALRFYDLKVPAAK